MSSAQLMENDISLDADTDQYLTFMLAGEEYGVDILRVQEIKGWDSVTPIPNTPQYIKGVINLRGTIVPIFDLRERFGLEPIPYGPTTVVIVLKVMREGESRTMGVVVDAVSEVYNIKEEELKASPDFGASVSTEFVQGLATIEETMIIVLDIDFLLNSSVADELELS
ncbi:MAG TPA: purine-binding chemotaxis protein CheW [Candidatus Tenderia sp.]|nr:purine-binding chemotaxis protein CheW [Candidatus Tenderia sp.]